MSYATISELARRWQVDRATARAALNAAHISPSEHHASPRFAWSEVLLKIENVPTDALVAIDPDDRLLSAVELADRLGVTPQTIRNYGKAGLLHAVKITDPIHFCGGTVADPDHRACLIDTLMRFAAAMDAKIALGKVIS
jgi:hypothetical protein